MSPELLSPPLHHLSLALLASAPAVGSTATRRPCGRQPTRARVTPFASTCTAPRPSLSATFPYRPTRPLTLSGSAMASRASLASRERQVCPLWRTQPLLNAVRDAMQRNTQYARNTPARGKKRWPPFRLCAFSTPENSNQSALRESPPKRITLFLPMGPTRKGPHR